MPSSSPAPGVGGEAAASAFRLRPNPEVRVVEEHGTVYLIPPVGRPLRLNRSASGLWRMLAEGRPRDEVVDRHAVDSGCDVATARDEIEQLIASLCENHYLMRAPADAPS